MKYRLLFAILVCAAFAAVAVTQDGRSAPAAGQNSSGGNGGGYGQRGARGGFGGMGRGLMGTVTDVTADHYTIKTETGDTYVVHFDANTRITRQPAGMRGPGAGPGGGQSPGSAPGGNGGAGRGGYGYGGNPPQQIKATDIKVGDVIGVMGDTDATAKTVAASRIMQLDPEAAERMKEMVANFGKTWLQGKVTAIDGTKITIMGALDNAPHAILADENTIFRKRRDPVTLADIQVGDMVRVEGVVKDGAFAATSVNLQGMMGGESASPSAGTPASPPAGAPPQ